MGVRVEGLEELMTDLEHARDDVLEQSAKVVGRGCLNIKKDAKERITGYAHLPHYPRSINYDVTTRGSVVTGEVGPDKAKLQGGLGSYIEYGTVHSGPHPHMNPALDAEEPRFIGAMEALAAELLEGHD